MLQCSRFWNNPDDNLVVFNQYCLHRICGHANTPGGVGGEELKASNLLATTIVNVNWLDVLAIPHKVNVVFLSPTHLCWNGTIRKDEIEINTLTVFPAVLKAHKKMKSSTPPPNHFFGRKDKLYLIVFVRANHLWQSDLWE